jgi:hypothetical protein
VTEQLNALASKARDAGWVLAGTLTAELAPIPRLTDGVKKKLMMNLNAVNNELSSAVLASDRLEDLLAKLGCEGVPKRGFLPRTLPGPPRRRA